MTKTKTKTAKLTIELTYENGTEKQIREALTRFITERVEEPNDFTEGKATPSKIKYQWQFVAPETIEGDGLCFIGSDQ